LTNRGNDAIRYGLYVPNFGKVSFARTLAELASEAEDCGWDGFFLWDHLVDEGSGHHPTVDTYTALSAIAMNTKRIRIGTTVSPLARRRPWLVARQTASLDHLSDGRLILGVGLGFVKGEDYETFGEVSDDRVRAEKLDESLEIITGLWTGQPFTYEGKHYRVKRTVFLPPTKQKPRIPIWVGGFWPHKGPFRRAAKWDGVLPLHTPNPIRPSPGDLRNILAYIKERRKNNALFDAAIIGWGSGKDRDKNAKKIRPYIEAGMTWWLEGMFGAKDSLERMRASIRMGPPRI
jgi:alkanesulfonate monooxygenase SsuD/methylene tetrahydromethanopterin reductase-like flavin-dependent oxidoreductase (luciferase family)